MFCGEVGVFVGFVVLLLVCGLAMHKVSDCVFCVCFVVLI